MTEAGKLSILVEADVSALDRSLTLANQKIDGFTSQGSRQFLAFRQAVDPVGVAAEKMGAQIERANAYLSAGKISAEQHAQALQLAKVAYDDVARAAQGTARGHAEAAGAAGLNRNQLLELQHVARSAFDSLAAGQSPLRVIAFEGGRLTQALGAGEGGVKGALTAMGAVINPATVGIALLTGALAAGAISAFQYAASVHEIEKATRSLSGQLSGATVDQIQRLAEAQSKAGDISVGAAEKVETALITTGHVTAAQLDAASRVVEGFARSTGASLTETADLFAKAFADPAAGAESLGRTYGLLTKAEAEHIKKLQDQGNYSGALADLVARLNGELLKTPDILGKQASGWDAIGAAISRAASKLGLYLADVAGLDGDAGKLRNAERRLAGLEQQGARGANSGIDNSREILLARSEVGILKAQQLGREIVGEARTAERQKNQSTFVAPPKKTRARRGPEDQSDSLDAAAQKDLDAADKAYAAAVREAADAAGKRAEAFTVSGREVLEQEANARDAQARRDQIGADAQAQLDAVYAEMVKVLKSKADAHRREQLAVLSAAAARIQDASAIKQRTVDEDEAYKREKIARDAVVAALQEQQALKARVGGYLDETDRLNASLAVSYSARRASALTVLGDERRRSDDEITGRFALQRAQLVDPVTQAPRNADAVTKLGELDGQEREEKALNAGVYAVRLTQTLRETEAPLAKWVREGQEAAKTVGDSLQSEAVKGLDAFNEGLADAIVNGKSLGDTFSSIFKSMEADLIRYLAKQAEVGLFGDAKGGALFSSVLSLLPHHAAGTDFAPGGPSVVGEHGPEVLNVPRGAQVIPNDILRQISRGVPVRSASGGSPITLHVAVDAGGAFSFDHVQGAVERGVRKAIGVSSQAAPGRLQSFSLLGS